MPTLSFHAPTPVARAIRARGNGDIGKMLGHILDYAAKFPLKEMGVMLIVVIILLALVNKIPPLIAGIITGAMLAIAHDRIVMRADRG